MSWDSQSKVLISLHSSVLLLPFLLACAFFSLLSSSEIPLLPGFFVSFHSRFQTHPQGFLEREEGVLVFWIVFFFESSFKKNLF